MHVAAMAWSMRLGALAVLGLALSGCKPDAQPDAPAAVQAFSCAEGAYAPKLPPTLDDLRNLGALLRETKSPDSEMRVTRHALSFDGLSLTVLDSLDKRRPLLLESLVVTRQDWAVTGMLRVGMAAEPMAKRWGLPTPLKDGRWRLGAPGPESFSIDVQRGKIQAINISCYTG